MNLLKLIHFELNRIFKVLLVLLIAVPVVQLIGAFIASSSYMRNFHELVQLGGMTEDQATSSLGLFDFRWQVMDTFFFVGPIFIGITTVLFYIFLIWYRDWFGKNTFIYRLLMLPTERVHVYLAKLITILIITFSFVAVQILAIQLEWLMVKATVPESLRLDVNMQEALSNYQFTSMLYPTLFMEFVLSYLAGIIIVAIIFTSILFERSFRIPGIVYGLLYAVIAILVALIPIILQETVLAGFFYPIELLGLTVMSGLAALALSIVTSGYLLRKKIRV